MGAGTGAAAGAGHGAGLGLVIGNTGSQLHLHSAGTQGQAQSTRSRGFPCSHPSWRCSEQSQHPFVFMLCSDFVQSLAPVLETISS